MGKKKKKKERAGIIPFIVDGDNSIKMMFMKPSDSKYGGSEFQLAKGKIDSGENPLEAAIRETSEELGLRESNIKWIKKLGYYFNSMHIYVAEVFNSDPKDFDDYTFETGDVAWMTEDEFNSSGRKLHKSVIRAASKLIASELSDTQ